MFTLVTKYKIEYYKDWCLWYLWWLCLSLFCMVFMMCRLFHPYVMGIRDLCKIPWWVSSIHSEMQVPDNNNKHSGCNCNLDSLFTCVLISSSSPTWLENIANDNCYKSHKNFLIETFQRIPQYYHGIVWQAVLTFNHIQDMNSWYQQSHFH